MKKSAFILLVSLALPFTSCAPNKFYLVNSEGIFTYNRHTGQVELMWETSTQKIEADTMGTQN